MTFMLGTKIGMSQMYRDDGRVLPVTLIKAGPLTVTQVKKGDEKDGYRAIQVGFGLKRKATKPEQGHLKDLENFRYIREFRVDSSEGFERGQKIDVSEFTVGQKVNVSGVSKGKGFQGVVKRYNFKGGRASHGGKHNLRQPGSIGATWPQRVLKGTRMAGRMGHERITVRNLEIVHVDPDKNIIAIKGALPGTRGTLIELRGEDKQKKV